MNKNSKILALVLMAILGVSVCYGIAQIYWTRSIHQPIKVIGINADLLVPSLEGFKLDTVAIGLNASNSIGLAIKYENFYNLWMNITVSANTTGSDYLTWNVTGQYFAIWKTPGYTDVHQIYVPEHWHYVPWGTTGNIAGYTVVDKTKMMLRLVDSYSEDVPPTPCGGMLVLTFHWDTEHIFTPANYDASILVQMGNTPT